MDEKELQQKIALYYSKLPPDLQEVFSKMEWLETLKQISTKYGLNDEQIQTLGTETTLVLLGIIHLEEYEEIIKTKLDLVKESAEKMLGEIDEAVLKNIRPQLFETFSKNTKELEEEPTPVEEELDERFSGLSEGIRKIIVQLGYYTKLYVVAEENKLTVPQMGTLEEITTGVITNSIHPEDFEKMLVKNLGLPAGTVQKIVNEINEKILGPIREKMKEVYSRPESSVYEVKPARNAFSIPASNVVATSGWADAGGPQIKKNVIRVIRPTSEATDPILDTMELKEGNPAIDQKMQPILGQKLADSYKASTVKTDHSIENMTKDKSIGSGAPKTYPPNADPYREIPE